MDTTNTTDISVADRLAAAATTAAFAPSIHNTQPWTWRIHDGIADLYAATDRQLSVIDPDRRLLTVSCGTALHHARVALAADGLDIDVDLMPAPDDPSHLARITVTGSTVVTDAAMRVYETIPIRHTDRRALLDEPVKDSDIAAFRKIANGYATGLHPLGRADMLNLAAATSRAQRDEVDDVATRHELDAWTGDQRPADAGIPDANILDQPAQTTVPSRDFGHVGTLAVTNQHDSAAIYAILYGLHDEPSSWIQAGEALSAIWLYATEHNVAVLPLSAAVEEAFTRQSLHRMLAGLGYACLAVRLGITDASQPTAPRTPRLPIDTTVEVVR